MNYKIKIILTIALLIAFAFNKANTVQKENKKHLITKDWNEKDKNIKNPELKQLIDELKKEFMFENDILNKDFKQKQQKLKEEYLLKRETLIKQYKTKDKELIKPIKKSNKKKPIDK